MWMNEQVITLENDKFNAETFRLFLEKLLASAAIGRNKAGIKRKEK
jgi:hypothetical protein